jgi:divalent metal cation (Fe/Co/Zn/Cd) transporter
MLLMSLSLVSLSPSPARRAVLTRRVRLFVAATITYNVIEAIVAITAGTLASSTALIGFGLDSVIEVASAAAVAWQFSSTDHERRERTALRIIAVSFYALATYVTVESVRALIGADRAEHSTIGLVLATVSLAVMPILSAAQRRAGRELGSASAVADSKQTLLCTYLSAVLLVGLAVNSLFGWWWVDPIAALVIAVVAGKEGREAWRGDACCSPAAALRTPDTADGCSAHAAIPRRRDAQPPPRRTYHRLPSRESASCHRSRDQPARRS